MGNLCFQSVIWKLYAFQTPSIWNMRFPCYWRKYYRSRALCHVYIFSSQIVPQCLHVSSKSASMSTRPSEIKQNTKIRIWKFSKTPILTTPLISQIKNFPSLSFGNIFSQLSSLPYPAELERPCKIFQNCSHLIKETLKIQICIFISSPGIWNLSNLKHKKHLTRTISNFSNLKLFPLKGWKHFFFSFSWLYHPV